MLFIYLFIYCSGQAAVITPRQVISGLGSHRVNVVAAAKHHTVIATQSGEVFTWGSNRGMLFLIFHMITFADKHVSYCQA